MTYSENSELVASIVKLNGAYLIEATGTLATDIPVGDLTSAASSIVRAKRVARDLAGAVGYNGPFFWQHPSASIWWLETREEVS